MTNYELMLELNGKLKKNIENLYTSGKMDDLNKCISFSNDFDMWLSCCDDFSKYKLIKEAQTECINSICLCAQGFYKEAIMALRQFLEHTLFAVMLSTNDYKYRLWKAGKIDMSWTQLMDRENGIFSVQFIQTYANDVDEIRSMELLTIAKDIYRECSEFVHGNYVKLAMLPDHIAYNEKMTDQYIKCFESIKYVICMALFIRFRETLNNPDNLIKLEPLIFDSIGMLPEIQLLYHKGGFRDE